MKVLIDPVYSARLTHCSTAMKCWRMVRYFEEMGRDDVFFYWLVPDHLSEEEREWLAPLQNVQFIAFPYHKDRVREYLTYPPALEAVHAFNGDCWDFDVLVTSRTTSLPYARAMMHSPREKRYNWTKKVILLEEMPLMGFKPTVPTSNPEVQDLMALSGYLAADETFITILHEKTGIVRTARKYLTPSNIIQLDETIKVASPAIVNTFDSKDEAHRYKKGERPFCLAFVGRVSVTDNIEAIYDTMVKHWVTKGDEKIRLLVSTVTTHYKIPPPDMVEYVNAPRDEFWRLIREEMDVALYLPPDAGFGMSLMEPLMFGTPVIVLRAEWSEALLGKDYPFFVDTPAKAYAMVWSVRNKYEAWYERFVEWQQTTMRQLFEPGGAYELNLYEELYRSISEHGDYVLAEYRKQFAGRQDNSILEALVEDDLDEMVMLDHLARLGREGRVGSIASKLREDDRDRRGLVWSTPWNDFRLLLKAFHGYVDASNRLGHLKKETA